MSMSRTLLEVWLGIVEAWNTCAYMLCETDDLEVKPIFYMSTCATIRVRCSDRTDTPTPILLYSTFHLFTIHVFFSIEVYDSTSSRVKRDAS